MVQSTIQRVLPGDVARDIVADPVTRDAVVAFAELMGAIHRARAHMRPSTRSLLIHLAKAGPQRSTDLATHAHLDASTVSRHLARLEADGLIIREADANDRRAQRVSLTDAGFAEARAAIADIVRRNELLLADWSADDRRAFARLLTNFVSRFEAVHTEGTTA